MTEIHDNCPCLSATARFDVFHSVDVGLDMTNGRHGEVRIKTCKTCGSTWLHYFVEFEYRSNFGRWYRGLVSPEVVENFDPAQAAEVLERLPSFFYGGSYFQTNSARGSGRVAVDG
jgi:hypothetical protein